MVAFTSWSLDRKKVEYVDSNMREREAWDKNWNIHPLVDHAVQGPLQGGTPNRWNNESWGCPWVFVFGNYRIIASNNPNQEARSFLTRKFPTFTEGEILMQENITKNESLFFFLITNYQYFWIIYILSIDKYFYNFSGIITLKHLVKTFFFFF